MTRCSPRCYWRVDSTGGSVRWEEVEGVRVASVADGALVVTFAQPLTLSLFENLVDRLPGQIVVLERAFVDDEARSTRCSTCAR